MTRQLSGWAATMFALSSLAGCDSDGAASGGSGQGGSSNETAATGTTSVTNGAATTTTQTSGVGGSSFVCDPPADPGSLYELYAESQDPLILEPVSMCQFRGDVLLVVNTAAI